jgi:hypothetical protein
LVDEAVVIELFRLQRDRCGGGDRAAVEHPVHDRLGPSAFRCDPVDGEQLARRDAQAEFLGDLAGTPGLRWFAMLQDAAGQ